MLIDNLHIFHSVDSTFCVCVVSVMNTDFGGDENGNGFGYTR